MMKCDCAERIGIQINSMALFEELQEFFSSQVNDGIFQKEKPERPYYVWKSTSQTVEYYATAWYRCRACGCLWEFEHPDFPARGSVKKYEDGIYTGTKTVVNDYM